MKNQIIILVLISTAFAALTNSNQCTCSELTVQSDCSTGGCAWVTVNGSSSCQAATTTTDCTTYTTETACDNTPVCAYKGGACAQFSGTCSDYTTTTVGGCALKSSKCTEGTLASGTYPCVSAAVTCSAQQSADTCNGKFQDDGKICYYSSSACAAYDMSKCSTRTIQDLCTGGCVWANNACAAETCASITDTTQCTSVYSDDSSSITVCAVSGTTCADAADATGLTSANCLKNTYGFFYWDGSACSACSGSSSNSYLLAFIGAVVMLFI